MRYIGLDVHKDNITACVLTSTGKPKFEKDFLKESGNWILDELLDFGDKEGFCVMMESGTYAYALTISQRVQLYIEFRVSFSDARAGSSP